MASKTLAGFGKDLGGLGAFGQVAAVGLAGVAAAGLGLAAGIGSAIGTAMDFESAMSAVAAVAGGTDADLQRLSDTALQLGQDTTLSGVGATEAALAMRELAAAGLTVDEIVGGAALGALRLASAGGIDVARASEIAAMALANFGLEGEDAARVADLFASASNSSAISVDDIAEALKYVGPIADSMGLSLEEVTATIAALGNQGIKSSQAGTSLRSMLVNLAKPSKEASKVIRDLGLEFFDSGGKMKSLANISGELKAGMANLTDQQRAAALATLFGNEALTAATVLYGEGAEGINTWLSEITNGATAAEVGAKRNDNLRGSLETLKGAAETALIAFGLGMTPALKDFALGVAGGVSALIPFLTLLGAGLGRALAAGIGVLQQFGGYVVGIATAILGAFGQLQSGQITLAQFIGGVKTLVATVLGDIRTLLSNAATLVAPYLSAIGAAIVTALPIVGAEVLKLAQLFGGWVATTAIPLLQANLPLWLGTLGTWFGGTVLPAVGGWLLLLGQAFGSWVATTAVPWLVTNLPLWLAALGGWLAGTALPAIATALAAVGAAFGDWVTTKAVPYLAEKLPEWSNALSTWLTGTALPAVATALVAVGQAFGEWVTTTAVPYLRERLPEWQAAVVGWIQGTAVPAVEGAATELAAALTDWLTTEAIPQVEANMPAWIAAITGGIDSANAAVDAGTTLLAEALVEWVDAAITGLDSNLGLYLLLMVAWLPTVLVLISQHTAEWGRAIVEWAGAPAQAELMANLNALGNSISTWILTLTFLLPVLAWKLGTAIGQRIADGATAAVSNFSSLLYQAGVDLINGLLLGIQSKFGAVQALLGELTNMLPSWKGPPERDAVLLFESGQLIMQGLINGISSEELDLQKKLADVTSAIAKAVTDMLAASRALAGFNVGSDAPSGDQLAWFGGMVDAMLTTLGAVAARFEAEALEHTGKFAETVGKVGGSIKGAIEGLLALGATDWANRSPDGHALAWFAHLIASLIANFREAARMFDSEGLDAATEFGDAASAIGGSVEGALKGLRSLAEYDFTSGSPNGEAMGWLRHLLESVVLNFAQAAKLVGAEGLAEAREFAKAVDEVTASVKGGLEMFGTLSEDEGIPKAALEAVFTALTEALGWARQNVALAQSLDTEATTFRDAMARAAAKFSEGLRLHASIGAPAGVGGGNPWQYSPGGMGGGGKTSNVTINNPVLLGRDSIVAQQVANLVSGAQQQSIGYTV